MKLIVGLGNPGRQYENTRHNIGFIALDNFAKKYDLNFKSEKKFQGQIAFSSIQENKFIVLKPETFMNLSGKSILDVARYYKVDVCNILILVDDLDMKLGKLRLRDTGSSGGHNGLKSISACFHTNDYLRLKIGIGRDKLIAVNDFVLGKFSQSDLLEVSSKFNIINEVIEKFILNYDYLKLTSILTKQSA
ncbi:MAG: aminoacyl-tRNA hydrolase [Anaeroplasmataceae bacterium]